MKRQRIGRVATWILVMTIAIVIAPSAALASANDAAATRAYIQADYRLVQTAVGHAREIEAVLHGVLARVRSECPMAAASSPQDPESTQLSNEVIGAMVTAAVRLDVAAGRRFVREAGRLSWSDRALTRSVRLYAGKVATLDALAPPNLCGDVRSWATGGFKALPASTVAFAPRFMEAWVAPGELPPAVARYEGAEDRQLANRTKRLEERFSELEAKEVETWGSIMDALGLWP